MSFKDKIIEQLSKSSAMFGNDFNQTPLEFRIKIFKALTPFVEVGENGGKLDNMIDNILTTSVKQFAGQLNAIKNSGIQMQDDDIFFKHLSDNFEKCVSMFFYRIVSQKQVMTMHSLVSGGGDSVVYTLNTPIDHLDTSIQMTLEDFGKTLGNYCAYLTKQSLMYNTKVDEYSMKTALSLFNKLHTTISLQLVKSDTGKTIFTRFATTDGVLDDKNAKLVDGDVVDVVSYIEAINKVAINLITEDTNFFQQSLGNLEIKPKSIEVFEDGNFQNFIKSIKDHNEIWVEMLARTGYDKSMNSNTGGVLGVLHLESIRVVDKKTMRLVTWVLDLFNTQVDDLHSYHDLNLFIVLLETMSLCMNNTTNNTTDKDNKINDKYGSIFNITTEDYESKIYIPKLLHNLYKFIKKGMVSLKEVDAPKVLGGSFMMNFAKDFYNEGISPTLDPFVDDLDTFDSFTTAFIHVLKCYITATDAKMHSGTQHRHDNAFLGEIDNMFSLNHNILDSGIGSDNYDAEFEMFSRIVNHCQHDSINFSELWYHYGTLLTTLNGQRMSGLFDQDDLDYCVDLIKQGVLPNVYETDNWTGGTDSVMTIRPNNLIDDMINRATNNPSNAAHNPPPFKPESPMNAYFTALGYSRYMEATNESSKDKVHLRKDNTQNSPEITQIVLNGIHNMSTNQDKLNIEEIAKANKNTVPQLFNRLVPLIIMLDNDDKVYMQKLLKLVERASKV